MAETNTETIGDLDRPLTPKVLDLNRLAEPVPSAIKVRTAPAPSIDNVWGMARSLALAPTPVRRGNSLALEATPGGAALDAAGTLAADAADAMNAAETLREGEMTVLELSHKGWSAILDFCEARLDGDTLRDIARLEAASAPRAGYVRLLLTDGQYQGLSSTVISDLRECVDRRATAAALQRALQERAAMTPDLSFDGDVHATRDLVVRLGPEAGWVSVPLSPAALGHMERAAALCAGLAGVDGLIPQEIVLGLPQAAWDGVQLSESVARVGARDDLGLLAGSLRLQAKAGDGQRLVSPLMSIEQVARMMARVPAGAALYHAEGQWAVRGQRCGDALADLMREHAAFGLEANSEAENAEDEEYDDSGGDRPSMAG